jgi:hypothetical protein
MVWAVPFTLMLSITFAWALLGACAESAWVLAAFQLVRSVDVICLTVSPVWSSKLDWTSDAAPLVSYALESV